MSSLDRRRFLHASAALGGTLVSSGIGRAAPARIDAPVVDRVVIREIIDNCHDVSLGPRAVRGSNCHRGPCLHDRRGATHRHRVRALQYLGRVRDQGRAGLRRERLYEPSFHRRRAGRQAAAGPALARACHLFPARRPRAGGHQRVRACRHHQHAKASPGGQRRRKDLRARRRLFTFSLRPTTICARSWRS